MISTNEPFRPTKSFHEATDAERRAAFDAAWEMGGGFGFMFGAFNDIAISEEANLYACEYIRFVMPSFCCEILTLS